MKRFFAGAFGIVLGIAAIVAPAKDHHMCSKWERMLEEHRAASAERLEETLAATEIADQRDACRERLRARCTEIKQRVYFAPTAEIQSLTAENRDLRSHIRRLEAGESE